MLKQSDGVQGISVHLSEALINSMTQQNMVCALPEGNLVIIARDLVVPLISHGAVFRKQDRLLEDTVAFIHSCGDEYSTNSLLDHSVHSDRRGRTMMMAYLATLVGSEEQPVAFIEQIVEGIMSQYDKIKTDKRDFANSLRHRWKNRLIQALLVLLGSLSPFTCEKMLCWLCKGLAAEHQQPSLRYFHEWAIALCVIRFPCLLEMFFEQSKLNIKTRVGSVGSFQASLALICCTSKDPEILTKSMRFMLPWLTAQHWLTRLYTQVCVRKLWLHCQAIECNEVLDTFRETWGFIQAASENLQMFSIGKSDVDVEQMLNDFFFQSFSAAGHYSLETIYHEFPRLALVAEDEWIKVEDIQKYTRALPVDDSSQVRLRLRNTDRSLSDTTPAPWVKKAAGDAPKVLELSEVMTEGENIGNVQKKITPWNVALSDGNSTFSSKRNTKTVQKSTKLILIASLVDKATNLGGLCRTCEVFGVDEYVVGSLAVVKDPNFTNLSLTAQQWMQMKEVKPNDLSAYLKGIKQAGYTVVALEQAADSTPLQQYAFPPKTAILLGNERSGVPYPLLQQTDACIEIPQSGVIRSLNVHVSGALILWEHTRQRLLADG